MELHNDEVPADEVWAVTIEDPAGTNIEWFLTGKAASEDYRHVIEWWERFSADVVWDTTVARWYVELPRRGMPRDEVDAWVNFVLTSPEGGGIYRRRLDVKRFVASEKEANA
jgi:hypothetical protein